MKTQKLSPAMEAAMWSRYRIVTLGLLASNERLMLAILPPRLAAGYRRIVRRTFNALLSRKLVSAFELLTDTGRAWCEAQIEAAHAEAEGINYMADETVEQRDEREAREYHASARYHHGAFEMCHRSPCIGFRPDAPAEDDAQVQAIVDEIYAAR